jgi:hypothetical protein
MSKKIVDKCSTCGVLFEDHKEYERHVLVEKELQKFRLEFPKEESIDFANGEWPIQRSEQWLEHYKDTAAKLVQIYNNNNYTPWSYAWFRCLDDGESMFYGVAVRALCVCPICFKEWGQQYHANQCALTHVLIGSMINTGVNDTEKMESSITSCEGEFSGGGASGSYDTSSDSGSSD